MDDELLDLALFADGRELMVVSIVLRMASPVLRQALKCSSHKRVRDEEDGALRLPVSPCSCPRNSCTISEPCNSKMSLKNEHCLLCLLHVCRWKEALSHGRRS